MALREVDLGLEATYGTAASTFVFMRCTSFEAKNAAPLEKPKETTGTAWALQKPRGKGRQCNWTAKVYIYPDMSAYWLALLCGAAVVTAVPSAVGAFSHLFKPGGSSIKSATLRWKQVSSAGTLWWQSVGCKAKTVKLTTDANGMPMLEIAGIGKYAQNISAPGSPPSDTTAAYITPFNMDQQALTLNAVAWTKPKKLGVNIDNGIAPDWSIQATRDFSRIKIGDVSADGDIEAFLDAYTGSVEEAQDGTSSLLNAVVYSATDLVTGIGTGTPTHPSFTLTIPKPYVDDDSPDSTATDTEEKGKLAFAYDSALASAISLALVSELTSSIYTGT